MSNCEKLLRAFIEASGYEVEEAVTHKEYINVLKGNLFCDDIEQKCVEEIIDYKVTKRAKPLVSIIACQKCGTHLSGDAPLNSCLCKNSKNLIRM